MSDELIEALARKLAVLRKDTELMWDCYIPSARECLRQMEWVRHVCEEDQDYGMPSVSLAPEDWQP